MNELLKDAYGCLAELWCSPQDVDMKRVRGEARELVERLNTVGGWEVASLSRFLEAGPVCEEEYVGLFELEPQCSLYLGSHAFEEPKTCAQAGVSDRNEYMIELSAIYRHFGYESNGNELPDYLPLMVEFLSLTAHRRTDALRKKMIDEYLLPHLPPLSSTLKNVKSSYAHLLQALEAVLKLDSERTAVGGPVP